MAHDERVDFSFEHVHPVESALVEPAELELVDAVHDDGRDHGRRVGRVVGDRADEMGRSAHRRHARHRHRGLALDVARRQTVDALERTLAETDPDRQFNPLITDTNHDQLRQLVN